MSAGESNYYPPSGTMARSMAGSGLVGHSDSVVDKQLKTLQDSNQRDDIKLRSLQDLWNSVDLTSTSPSMPQLIESMVRVFMKLLTETAPQFISENNTQQLRKLMLEILLRTSQQDVTKHFSKNIQNHMVKLLQSENEVNGQLALKILIDHLKINRMQFTQEVGDLVKHFRNVFIEMKQNVASGHMFEVRPQNRPAVQGIAEETIIETSLQQCFYQQQLSLVNGGGQGGQSQDKDLLYLLIPRARQSVKVMQEVPMLIVMFYQLHKHHIQQDILDFIETMVDFINVPIPQPPETSGGRSTWNKDLADELHSAQVKALSFLAFMARTPPQTQSPVSRLISENGTRIVSGVLAMFEQCPVEIVSQRRELLIAAKFFFSNELKTQFLPVVPRLFSENLLLGPGYTSIDNMRVIMYSMVADLLHHLRMQLPYPTLCHAVYVFSRCLHDPSLPANTQSMSIRLIMNLCEAFTNHENKNGHPCRDVMFQVLEMVMCKLKVLTVYHLPLMFEQHGDGIKFNRGMKSSTPEPEEKTATRATVHSPYNMCLSSLDSEPSTSWSVEEEESDGERDSARRCSIDSLAESATAAQPATSHADKMDVEEEDCLPPLPDGHDAKKTTPIEQITLGLWIPSKPPLQLVEIRNMIKFLLQAAKYIVQAMAQHAKRTDKSVSAWEEKEVLVRLFKYGLQCLDVFMLAPSGGRSSSMTVKKEEKEAIEALCATFTFVSDPVFKEIFSEYIDCLIERISGNLALQLMCNQLLVNPDTSAKFGAILVHYLLSKMPEMAVTNERSALYLKLFKLIFSAVSCAQSTGCADVEQMLKPFLHDLIRDASRLALRGRDPLNYFLLLRALFRSIGGGAHDVLYTQFLPLLPSLLQHLNTLQSCPHRQQMHELFVELCLTVPVRLSSLLPYLPLLMDPLVCALNGSPTLVQQGLRTLELCVDNLQPEYLYEHMAPVRAALMQGLWRTVGNPADMQAATTAFRILGKFGGSNRKMLCEPQPLRILSEEQVVETVWKLEYDRQVPAGKRDYFVEQLGADGPVLVELAIGEAVRVAAEQLRLTSVPDCAGGVSGSQQAGGVHFPQPPHTPPANPPQLRKHAAEIVKRVLLCGIGPAAADPAWMNRLAKHIRTRVQSLSSLPSPPHSMYRCVDESARKMYVDALAAMFYAVTGRDLRAGYVKLFNAVLRQLVLMAVVEQTGGSSLSPSDADRCMDSAVLVDACVVVLSDANKDFVQAAVLALKLIIDTLKTVMDGYENVICSLPLLDYLVCCVCELCYGPAWFARLGGASALVYIIENYPRRLIVSHLPTLLHSLLEVSAGLADEVSSGAIEMAEKALRLLNQVCLREEEGEEQGEKDALLDVFVEHYSAHLLQPDAAMRAQVLSLLRDAAERSNQQLGSLLARRRLHIQSRCDQAVSMFSSSSVHSQTAIAETLSVLLLTDGPVVTLTAEMTAQWTEQLIDIVSTGEQSLRRRRAYSQSSHTSHALPHTAELTALRVAAARALMSLYACGRGGEGMECEDREGCGIVGAVLAVLAEQGDGGEGGELLREMIVKSIEKVVEVRALPVSIVDGELSRLAEECEQRGAVTEQAAERMLYLARLAPGREPPALVQAALRQLTTWAQETPPAKPFPPHPAPHSAGEGRLVMDSGSISCLVRLLRLLSVWESVGCEVIAPAANAVAALHQHRIVQKRIGWDGLVGRVMCRWPLAALRFIFHQSGVECASRRALWRRVLRHSGSVALRTELESHPDWLTNMLQGKLCEADASLSSCEWMSPIPPSNCLLMYMEMQALSFIDIVASHKPGWISNQQPLVDIMRQVWRSSEFKERYVVKSGTEEEQKKIHVKFMCVSKYKVPKLMVYSFVRVLRETRGACLSLLIDTMTVFLGHFVADFTFLRNYIEHEIVPTYSLKWRREAFREVMRQLETDKERSCKNLEIVRMIQHVLIPCLQWAFERWPVEKIVGCIPRDDVAPGEEQEENLVVRFAGLIKTQRDAMSDGMIVVLFQLSILLVQHASSHIHDNTNRKQSQSEKNRLRVFMLFAWPCLSSPQQDVTCKYTGHLLLASIIDKFTINRKIVLQVFTSLMGAYQQDNRDVVKRAIDLLTPAVPHRLVDDGHRQLLQAVKKVLTEETHNLPHLFHCLHMITRNYRVYFAVRHDLLPSILAAMTRLISAHPGGYTDSRKLAVEVCEMVIKWDLLRQQKLDNKEKGAAAEAKETVESRLEALKTTDKEDKEGEKEKEKEGGAGGGVGEAMDTSSAASVKTEPAAASSASAAFANAPPIGPAAGKEVDEKLDVPISKEHADHVVNLLLKMATTMMSPSASSTSTQQQQQTTAELNKRSIGTLRAALKPQMWGERVTIRNVWLEKQLSIPQEVAAAAARDQQINQAHFAQALQTLDVLLQLVHIMPKQLVLSTIRPLQRAIIMCLNSNFNQLVRTVNSLVGRLLEKTTCSPTGLDELDVFNQYMARFLAEQFNNYDKNPAAQITAVFTSFSLLRMMCLQEPAYLDTMVLGPFMRVIQKAVREHIQAGGGAANEARDKGVAELLSISLELLRPRIRVLTSDCRRTLSNSVLLPLIEGGVSDKILEKVVKVVNELVTTHCDENTANIGLPLMVRLVPVMERRYRGSRELARLYLTTVLYIYERPSMRNCEYATKLEEAFFWGLTFPEEELRDEFVRVQCLSMPRSVVDRLEYILCGHEWQHMRDFFWLRHALHILLVGGANGERASGETVGSRVSLTRDAATWWNTMCVAGDVATMVDDGMDASSSPGPHRFSEIIAEQWQLLAESSQQRAGQLVRHVCAMVLNLSDTSLPSQLWQRAFCSVWSGLNEMERASIQSAIPPMLSSAVHLPQTHSPVSVLSVMLDCVWRAQPPIHLDPHLIKYLSLRHRAWHRGVQLLELSAACVPAAAPPDGGGAMGGRTARALVPDNRDGLEVLECLADVYSQLGELDQFCAVWQKRAVLPQTRRMIDMITAGDTVAACEVLENEMDVVGEEMSRLAEKKNEGGGGVKPVGAARGRGGGGGGGGAPMQPSHSAEFELWFANWQKCTMELCRWQSLRDYANSPSVQDARLLMQCAPHLPDWALLRECRDQVAGCTPPDFVPSLAIYSCMLAVMDPDPAVIDSAKAADEQLSTAVGTLIRHWRTLPSLVSDSHIPLLQAMNTMQELNEASSVMSVLRNSAGKINAQVLTEMKSIIKTWRNRAPSVCDSQRVVCEWLDVRLLVYAAVVRTFDQWDRAGARYDHGIPGAQPQLLPASVANQSILPIHSSAQGQVLMARSARAARLYQLASDSLNKMHTLIAVPLMDAAHKVCEEIRLKRTMARDRQLLGEERRRALLEAADLCDSVRVDELQKDHICKLLCQKGAVMSTMERRDEAEAAFRAAYLAHDQPSNNQPSNNNTGSNVFKAWAHHCDRIYHENRSDWRVGCESVSLYLEASRCDQQLKAGKYIARALWTSAFLWESGEEAAGALNGILEKHAASIVPTNWVQWLSVLVSEWRRRPESGWATVLGKVAEAHPQHVFYQLRVHLGDDLIGPMVKQACEGVRPSSAYPALASLIATIQSADIYAMHVMLTEMSSLGDLWVERQLRYALQLKDKLFQCAWSGGVVSAECRSLMAEWMACLRVERGGAQGGGTWIDEPIAANKGVEPEEEFRVRFVSTVCSALEEESWCGVEGKRSLSDLTEAALKWTDVLRKRLAKLPAKLPLSSASPFLARFSNRMASVQTLADLLHVKNGQYLTWVASFGAHYECVYAGGHLAKRLRVRTHTGKWCWVLVCSGVGAVGRGTEGEGAVRLLAHINTLLAKNRESCRRHLSVMECVRVSANARTLLIEQQQPQLQPIDILAKALRMIGMRPDDLVAMWYDRLAADPNCQPQQLFREFVNPDFVSPYLMEQYLMQRVPDATHYYTLRKQLAQQVGVLGVVEWVAGLRSERLEHTTLHLHMATITNTFFTLDKDAGFNSTNSVPFRLTPNLQQTLGASLEGHLLWSLRATASALAARSPVPVLRLLMRDMGEGPEEEVVGEAERAERAAAVVQERIEQTQLAEYGGGDCVLALLSRARSPDALSTMPPRWHPWF